MYIIHSSYTLICRMKLPELNLTLPRICKEFALVTISEKRHIFRRLFYPQSIHGSLFFFNSKSTWDEAWTQFTISLKRKEKRKEKEKTEYALCLIYAYLSLCTWTIQQISRKDYPVHRDHKLYYKSSYFASSFPFERPEKSFRRCLSIKQYFSFFLFLMQPSKVLTQKKNYFTVLPLFKG